LPKKLINHPEGAKSARAFVRGLVIKSGGAKPFFRILHNREPVGNESVVLNNLVARGNYNAEFIALIVERFELEKVTLGEFFFAELEEK
jgi:hypothetical protein